MKYHRVVCCFELNNYDQQKGMPKSATEISANGFDGQSSFYILAVEVPAIE